MTGTALRASPATASLDRLSLDISDAATLDDVARALQSAVSTALRFGRLTLEVWREDTTLPSLVVSLDGKGNPVEGVPVPGTTSEILRRSFERSPRPVRIGSPAGQNGNGAYASFLAVPVVMRDKCIGAVSVQSRQPEAYSGADAANLASMAERIAPSIDRLRRQGASRGIERSLRLLGHAREIASRTMNLSLEELLRQIASLVAGELGTDCAIGFIRPGQPALMAAATRATRPNESRSTWLQTLLASSPALAQQLRQSIAPIVFDPDLLAKDPTVRHMFEHATAPYAIIFPPARPGSWLGGLALIDEQALTLDPLMQQVIGQITDVVAQAVECSAGSLQPASDQRLSDLLSRLHTYLLAETQLEPLLHDTVKAVAELVSADAAALYLSNANQDSALGGRIIHYACAEEVIAALEIAAFERPDELLVRETEFLHLDPPGTGEQERIRHYYPCRLAMPIRHGSQVRGTLFLFRATAQPFTRMDGNLAREIAYELSVALEQKRLLEAERRQREILVTVRNLAKRLNRAPSRQGIAEIAVEECATAFGSGKASVHLFEPSADQLVMASAFGLPLPFVTGTAHLSPGEGACGQAATQQSLVVVEDMFRDPLWQPLRRYTDDFPELRSAWALPLMAENEDLLGAIAVYHPHPGKPTESDLTLFQLLAHQVALALDRAQLADRTQDMYRATVASLAAAVDAKDPFTHNHSWQVAEYSRKIAEMMGLPSSEVAIIELAGLLHDVGKIGIPDRVLQKPEGLNPDEWAMMRRHSELGAKILGDNSALAAVVPLVRSHHERYDGRGYPDQLAGESIPLGAAIVSLADAFDTMTTDRPYRRSRTAPQAVAEIQRSSGTHFDPRVVRAFLDVVRAGDISMTTREARATTRELRLTRVMGVEARAFGLLQRISAQVSTLVDIERFLDRLNELMVAEFPSSICDVFVRDPETHNLMTMAHTGYSVRGAKTTSTVVLAEGRGIVGWVAEHGLTQNIGDVLEDSRHVVTGHRLVRSELAVPLTADGRCIGVLDLKHPDPAAFTSADQQVLEMVATYVAQAIEVADLHNRLKRQADFDSLTGLFNHRAFYRQLDNELARAQASGGHLALAVLDVDGLQAINDSAGHVAGDAVLRRIAGILASRVRVGDTVARYGGDEFAIIMPQAPRVTIEARLQAIAARIAQESARDPLPAVSWGIACYPEDGSRATELVGHADAAVEATRASRLRQ